MPLSSSQRYAAVSAPRSSRERSTYSLGAWMRSASRPTATKTNGAPRMSARSASGPLPPSLVNSTCVPNARSIARRAATTPGESIAERQVGMRVLRDDRLAPGTRVAAPDAVDLGGRPRPDALQRAEARLASGRLAVTGVVQPALLVEGKLGEELALFFGQRHHVVVEAGQRDTPVPVVQAGEQLREGVHRVGDPAAERPGVQVPRWPAQRDFRIRQAPHASADRRNARCPHRGVADDDDVGVEGPLALFQQLREVGRAGLLLALDEEGDADWWRLLGARDSVGADCQAGANS